MGSPFVKTNKPTNKNKSSLLQMQVHNLFWSHQRETQDIDNLDCQQSLAKIRKAVTPHVFSLQKPEIQLPALTLYD